MWTWSVSTSLRSRVSAVAGILGLSSGMTSSYRPALCQPLPPQNSSQPLYMSWPAWAMAPDSGARKPILIGPWANAAPAASIVIAAIVTAVSLRIDVPSLAILVLRLRILRPGHSTRTSAARSRLDRAAFCGTIAAFAGGLHGPSTMALLTPLTRDEVAPDLVSLRDECERVYPDFRHLWATMAHSPIVFRHVWGQLLDLKRESPVDARHFEIAILVVSHVTRCDYCVSHHTPRALGTGLTTAQVEYLATVGGASTDANGTVGRHPGFDGDESLVIDLARFILWAGMRAPAAGVGPRLVHHPRPRRLRPLAPRLSPPPIEGLIWRTTQCVAFNWDNDLVELDTEPEGTPRTREAKPG